MPPRLRILMVEDEALVAMLGEVILEQAGHQVSVAGTSCEAMAQMAVGQFDLALVDLGLPDMDGTALIAWMREAAPGVPIIVSTGYSNHGANAVSRCLPAGIPVLEKPWREQDLLQAIRSIARSASGRPRHWHRLDRQVPPASLAAYMRPIRRADHHGKGAQPELPPGIAA